MRQWTISWDFWLQWWLASAAGFLVGGLLALPIGFGLGEIVEKPLGVLPAAIVAGAMFGLCWGGGLGLAQWLVLQSRFERAWRWVLASLLGGMIGWAFIFGLMASLGWPELPSVMPGLLAGIALGFPVGAGQWLILRRVVGGAGWWLPASFIGLTLCLMVTFMLGGEGRELLATSVGSLLAGPLTGAVLVWLFRQRVLLV